MSFAPTQDPVAANNKSLFVAAVVMVIVVTPIDDLSIGGDDPSCCDESSHQEDVCAINDSSIAPMDAVATNNESLFVAAVVESMNAQPLNDLSRGCVEPACDDDLSSQGKATSIQC